MRMHMRIFTLGLQSADLLMYASNDDFSVPPPGYDASFGGGVFE